MNKLSRNRMIHAINYGKDSGVSYGGTKYQYGYHSLDFGGITFKGQRNNKSRISQMSYNFDNKVVFDIGCNSGGVLHILSDVIKYGIGVDKSSKLVNVANMIKSLNGENNINFYTFDLDNEALPFLENFLLEIVKVDVVLFLSMAKWVKKWKDVVSFCKSIAPVLIFESNGTPKQQTNQEAFLKSVYKNCYLKSSKSIDDPGQINRRLFVCGDD